MAVLFRDSASAEKKGLASRKKKIFLVDTREAIQRILVALPSFLPSSTLTFFSIFGLSSKIGAAGDKVETTTESIYHRAVYSFFFLVYLYGSYVQDFFFITDASCLLVSEDLRSQ